MVEGGYIFLLVSCLALICVVIKNLKRDIALYYFLAFIISTLFWVFSLYSLLFNHFDLNQLLLGKIAYISGGATITFSILYFASVFHLSKFYYLNLILLFIVFLIFVFGFGITDVSLLNGKLYRETGSYYFIYIFQLLIQILQFIIIAYHVLSRKSDNFFFRLYRLFFLLILVSFLFVFVLNILLPIFFPGITTNQVGPFFVVFVVYAFLYFVYRYHYQSRQVLLYEFFLFFSLFSLLALVFFDFIYFNYLFLFIFVIVMFYIVKLFKEVEDMKNVSLYLLSQNRLLLYFFDHQLKNIITIQKINGGFNLDHYLDILEIIEPIIHRSGELKRVECEVFSIVDSALDVFNSIFTNSDFEINLNLEKFVFYADNIFMQNVFFNIIHNSYLHSGANHLKITGRFVDNVYSLKFNDNGGGFSDRELSRIANYSMSDPVDESLSGIYLSKRVCMIQGIDFSVINTAHGAEVEFSIRNIY